MFSASSDFSRSCLDLFRKSISFLDKAPFFIKTYVDAPTRSRIDIRHDRIVCNKCGNDCGFGVGVNAYSADFEEYERLRKEHDEVYKNEQ